MSRHTWSTSLTSAFSPGHGSLLHRVVVPITAARFASGRQHGIPIPSRNSTCIACSPCYTVSPAPASCLFQRFNVAWVFAFSCSPTTARWPWEALFHLRHPHLSSCRHKSFPTCLPRSSISALPNLWFESQVNCNPSSPQSASTVQTLKWTNSTLLVVCPLLIFILKPGAICQVNSHHRETNSTSCII